MKKNIVYALAVLALSANVATAAGPIGSSNTSRDYLVSASDLSMWGIGFNYISRERDVVLFGVEQPMKSGRVMGFVTVDPTAWMSLYAQAGGIDSEIGAAESTGDFMWGGGVAFRLLNHPLTDPGLLEKRFSVNASCEYNMTDATYLNTDVNWHELYATLTLSLVNDLSGNKLYAMNSIGLYGGLAFSEIFSQEIEAEDKIGGIAGLEFFATQSISFNVGVEYFSTATYNGGVRFRF